MAKLDVSGFDELELTLEEMADLPESVLDEMLDAQAAVIVAAQKAKGAAYGIHRTGMTLDSIKAGSPKRTKDGKSISIYPQGVNKDGNRNAEVAFVNEYGKRGQPARPFIRDANESAAGAAVSAAEQIYDDWLKGL